MPLTVTEIEYYAFGWCQCLRNVALPPNAVINNTILNEATDLLVLFDSIAEMIRELQHRFDQLPIHSLVYYQSFNRGVLQILVTAILRGELDPTGNEQDCLGMTPLHILTCSSVHNLEVYRTIIENYPTNLITEDKWGETPLLYAFWGGAPAEIIQFLLNRYQSLYPDHFIDWTMMVETMGRTDTPKERIENLLHVHQTLFPKRPIDWENLLGKFAEPSECSFPGRPFCERMQFLFTCGMSDRVKTLAFTLWRNHIITMIHTADFKWGKDNRSILRTIRDKLVHFEDELPKLKEATTILEIALWKMKMNDKSFKENMTQHQKKIKADESIIRQQCRVACGADVVIGHVLPYLISVD
jgi:hypothetical protein